jgi:hypothetical protein
MSNRRPWEIQEQLERLRLLFGQMNPQEVAERIASWWLDPQFTISIQRRE